MLKKPEFDQKKMLRVSEASGNILLWIRAMIETYETLLVVEPKRQSLLEAKEILQ